jgi:hypothetical protein
MENKSKIEELLVESLKRQDKMVDELKLTNQKLNQTNERLDQTNEKLDHIDGRLYKIEVRTDKVEEQLIKLNLQTVENTRAIFKLADKVEGIAELHKRVTKLEKEVFK